MMPSSATPLPMRIVGSGSYLPGNAVSTAEVCRAAFDATVSPEELESRTGIKTRHWRGADETVASVSVESLARALDASGVAPKELRRLILTNSMGFDGPMPATANAVAARLGIPSSCACFDVANACTGFLTAFDIASRNVATGIGPVAVVATELISQFLSPEERRTYAVLADGSAAIIMDRAVDGGAQLGCWFGSDGARDDRVKLSRQRPDRPRELVRFVQPQQTITGDVVDKLTDSIEESLRQAGLSMHDIRWFLLHQPNGVMYRRCAKALGIGDDRLVPVVQDVGSIGSASIPLSLDVLVRDRGGFAGGDLVVLAAVGAGLSYGAIVIRTERLPL
jgi:3-oxoacyl-(acyl-carrier-protein) synthase III